MSADYPTTLPNPVKADHEPKARVIASDLPGKESYVSRERDYTGTLDVAFFFSAEQAAVFYAWWRDDLAYGGLWFNCNWPALRPGAMVVQFVSEPSFAHVYNGAYRVSAKVQIRGASDAISAGISPVFYAPLTGGNANDRYTPLATPTYANPQLISYGLGGATLTWNLGNAASPTISWVETVANKLRSSTYAAGVVVRYIVYMQVNSYTGTGSGSGATFLGLNSGGFNSQGFNIDMTQNPAHILTYSFITAEGHVYTDVGAITQGQRTKYEIQFTASGQVRWLINDVQVRIGTYPRHQNGFAIGLNNFGSRGVSSATFSEAMVLLG